MDVAEAAVAEAAVAAKACEVEDVGEVSPEVASASCEKVSVAAAAAQEKLDNINKMLSARRNEKEKEEGQDELEKANRAATEFEHRFVATKLLKEATKKIRKADVEMAELTSSCTPLIEEGGSRFLVGNSVQLM